MQGDSTTKCAAEEDEKIDHPLHQEGLSFSNAYVSFLSHTYSFLININCMLPPGSAGASHQTPVAIEHKQAGATALTFTCQLLGYYMGEKAE